MANPMISIDDQFSARASQIVALELKSDSVKVSYLSGECSFVPTKSAEEAHTLHNRILNAIRDAEKCSCSCRPLTGALVSRLSDEGRITVNDAQPSIQPALARIDKIISLLRSEFDGVFDHPGFRDDLWLALQAIYGPDGAADFINYCRDPR